MQLTLPADKCEAIRREFGEAGNAWIERFPEKISALVDRFGLRVEGVAEAGLPINIIYFATMPDDRHAVLKIGYPHPEQLTEMATLPLYDKRFVPEVYACEPEEGVLLMERISPGTTFRDSDRSASRSTRVPEVISAFPVACDTLPDSILGLPRFDDWIKHAFDRFERESGTDHEFWPFVHAANRLYATLASRYPEDHLLHGDLHHENILADGKRGWCAIDPKGVIGPSAMEYGRFLHNFIEDEVPCNTIDDADQSDLCRVLEVRYHHFAEVLKLPVSVLAEVAFIDCVLSSCWTINSGHHTIGLQRVSATREMLG